MKNTSPSSNSTENHAIKLHRLAPWIILLATFLWLIPGNNSLPLMDRDEPRFARATLEMMEKDSWAVPYFNDEYRFDKPPLVYWCMAVFYKTLGVNEFSARMHSVLFSYLVALSIYAFGRRIRDPQSGLLASLAWLTLIQTQIHGRLCVADMPLLFFTVWAQRALYELIRPNRETAKMGYWSVILGLCLGFGFLTKWPVTMAIVVVTLPILRWILLRAPIQLTLKTAIPPLAIAGVITAAWGIPAYLATAGTFWSTGFNEHVIQRGSSAMNGRYPLPLYYLLTFWFSFFPWTFSFIPLFRKWRGAISFENWFLLAWTLSVYGMFSLAMTQLPHYVMPAFPAMCLILFCGRPWESKGWKGSENRTGMPSFPKRIHLVFSAVLLTVAALLYFKVHFPEGTEPLRVAAIAIIIFFIAWQATALCLSRRNWKWSLAFGALASLLFTYGSSTLRPLSIGIQARGEFSKVEPEAEIWGIGYKEPSLVFYSGRVWKFAHNIDLWEQELLERGELPTYALVEVRNRDLFQYLGKKLIGKENSWSEFEKNESQEAKFDEFLKNHPETKRIKSFSGWNFANSKWVELEWIQLGP